MKTSKEMVITSFLFSLFLSFSPSFLLPPPPPQTRASPLLYLFFCCGKSLARARGNRNWLLSSITQSRRERAKRKGKKL